MIGFFFRGHLQCPKLPMPCACEYFEESHDMLQALPVPIIVRAINARKQSVYGLWFSPTCIQICDGRDRRTYDDMSAALVAVLKLYGDHTDACADAPKQWKVNTTEGEKCLQEVMLKHTRSNPRTPIFASSTCTCNMPCISDSFTRSVVIHDDPAQVHVAAAVRDCRVLLRLAGIHPRPVQTQPTRKRPPTTRLATNRKRTSSLISPAAQKGISSLISPTQSEDEPSKRLAMNQKDTSSLISPAAQMISPIQSEDEPSKRLAMSRKGTSLLISPAAQKWMSEDEQETHTWTPHACKSRWTPMDLMQYIMRHPENAPKLLRITAWEKWSPDYGNILLTCIFEHPTNKTTVQLNMNAGPLFRRIAEYDGIVHDFFLQDDGARRASGLP